MERRLGKMVEDGSSAIAEGPRDALYQLYEESHLKRLAVGE